MIDENKSCMFMGYPDLDEAGVVEHLQSLIRLQTIANRDVEQIDFAPFHALHAYLKEAYPLIHERMELTVIPPLSLLYRLRGNGSMKKKPILLMAHQDVVPVTPGTEGEWTHDAFSGTVADGHIWGRGTLDMKNILCAQMEALTYLLSRGFSPDRDIYLAFGYDEECGSFGAASIAAYLKEQGIDIDFILDEGCDITHGEDYGASGHLVAPIGIFEKGYCDVQLVARSAGGHSSQPDYREPSALGKVAKALLAIEDNPFPVSLAEPFEKFYRAMGPYLDDPHLREICTDLDHRKEELISELLKTPGGSAMVRTTTAVTQAWGSPAPNLLPQKAVVNVNCRLCPGETAQSLLAHLREIVGDDGIEIVPVSVREASAVSPTDSEGFGLIVDTLHEFYPDILVVPTGMLGGTDSNKYECVCKNIYKFAPFFDGSNYAETIHATNERISIRDLTRGVRFYIRLLEKACGDM